MTEHARSGTIATLPNLLGLGRILATPVVMALLLLPGAGTDFAAAIVFVIAALSDLLDGWIARARDQVTPLGVFMDLAADKVLVAGVLVAMVEIGLVPTWIAATLLIREFVVQAVRQLAAAEDVVISARALGKAKTLANGRDRSGRRVNGGGPLGARAGHGAQHRLRLRVYRRRVADPGGTELARAGVATGHTLSPFARCPAQLALAHTEDDALTATDSARDARTSDPVVASRVDGTDTGRERDAQSRRGGFRGAGVTAG